MSTASISKITASRIRFLFDYNPMVGTFRRKSNNRIITHQILKLDGEAHELSRYIWLHYYGGWPPLNKLVDHKDRNHNNNKINNLRLASFNQNGFNMESRNPYGYKGITYQLDRPVRPWLAQIRIRGKKTNLGRYETAEEAGEVYRSVAMKYHREFACLK